MKIAVVGSLNMDLVVHIPQIPRIGETRIGGEFKTFPGGKGANQAVAASRLGGEVFMVGCVGDDSFGYELKKNLRNEKVNIDHVRVKPEVATGVALIQVDGKGQNTISVASGANQYLTAKMVETSLIEIGNFDVLVLSLEIPMDAVEKAALVAKNKNAKIVLNPAPAQPLENNLLTNIDFLIPNEHEVTGLIGGLIFPPGEIVSAAKKLVSVGVKNVIVTLGSKGSLLFDGFSHNIHRVQARKVTVVDTTAAGDCFVGAFSIALAKGLVVSSAVEFASAAASISVTREGAQPSMPFLYEMNQILMEGVNKE